MNDQFSYDPDAPSTDEVSATPSTFVYNPDTGEHAVDADEFSRLSDAKLIKESAFTPSENKFGSLGSFAADVFVSPAVGIKENLADNVKYYLGNTLVAVPRAMRFGNPIGAALGDLTGLNERTTTLGQHLANTETLLRMKKRDEAREQRFENMGYEMGTLPGAVGKAAAQGVGQAATMAIAPGLKEPMLMAQAAEAYKAKMTELSVEGEAAKLTDYARASGSAILAYGIERIGLDAMTGYFKPLAERTFRSFAGRVAQGALGEGAESAIQSVGEQSMDIGFGLKMPEDFSIQSVALEGVMGLIGGGAGGLAYASAARKKLATAYQDVLKYNGHEIPFNDALDLAEQTLSGVSFDMSQYTRQHASIDQSKIDSVEAYHSALTKRPVNAEGIAPEDIERVANRKRDFDAIVDSVMAQKEQYVEEYAMTAEDPMVEEARKYKTADEFVKAQVGEEIVAPKELERLAKFHEKATEKKKTLRSTGFSETAPEVAMKVKSLDSEITTKLNAIAALERKGDPVATKLKANLDKQLKDMGLLQEQASELQRLAVESRPDSDVAIDATMQASVKHMDTAMNNVSKKISETMNAIETAEVEKQLDLNDRLDELTEQYAELEQERKDILNGVVKPEGRIVTTAAKVRQIRYAQASTSLRNIMAARKATKQELASAYNAVKRAIKSTKLPRDVKNQLISDYAKAQSYEDLYTVYPKIQAAIDESLQAEKARLGKAWLARGIRQLVNNRFAEERAIGRALQAVFTQSGPAKSINSLVDKYVASVNHAVTAGKDNAQYMIDLARDLQLFIMQGSAGREAQAKAEVERRARVQEIFEKSLKARKAEAKARKQKKARGAAPLVPGAEDITDAPVEFSLGINDLYRSLMTMGADVQKLFNNSKPHFTLIQNRMRANETFSKLVEDAYGLKGAELNEALDADMRDNFIMLPAFDYEKPIDTNGVITYPKIEQRISHATARSVWAMTRNSDVRFDLTHGKDDKAQLQEDAVQKIEQWINDPKNERHKKIAEGEMAMLEDYARRIQALYAEVFPEEYFDPIESYFMTARIFSGEDLAFILPSDSMMPSQMQTKKFVGALQKRTGGQLLFKLQPDVINMRKYVNTMEHFLSYAKYVKELKQAVNDSRGTLTDVFGEKWLKRLDQQIDFLRDGGAIASLVNPDSMLDKLYTNVARVLVRAPTQYIKQRMGFFTANVNFAYASEAFSKADEAIIAGKSPDPLMQLIMSTSAVDDRYGASENYGLLQTEIGQTRKTHAETAKKRFFDRLFNTFPRLGDKHAYLSVAYAKAKEMYDKGAHPSTAAAAGIEEADTSQMTLDLARQSTWTIKQAQTGVPVLRSVMALSSATTQMFNRYWSNLTDGFNMYQSGKKKEGVEKMASTIVKWHFLVPMTYALAASGATAELKDYLRRIITGPAGELPIIGGVYNSTYSGLTALYDKMTGAEGGDKLTVRTFLESNLLGSVIAQVSKQVNDIVEAEDEGNPVWVEAAEASSLIFAISTGFPAQELAKISASVYDNTNNAEQGAYPWMLALSGYTRKQVEKAREAQ